MSTKTKIARFVLLVLAPATIALAAQRTGLAFGWTIGGCLGLAKNCWKTRPE